MNNNPVRDYLIEGGFHEEAECLTSPIADYIGKPIAIYGPRFIFRGVLKAVTPTELVLTNVYQIKNVEHNTSDVEDEVFFTKEQIYPRTSIMNYGPVIWA